MKDPLYTCKICGVKSTIKETIDRQFCHKRHTSTHYSEDTKTFLKEKLKRKSAFPNKVQVRSWNRKYGKEKTDN